MAHQTRKQVCALLIGALREKLKRNGRALAFPQRSTNAQKARRKRASTGPALLCGGKVSKPSPKSVCRLDCLGDFDCIEQVCHGVLSSMYLS
jgi:hypothetical protein